MKHGEGQAGETFQNGRPAAAGGAPAPSSGSRGSSPGQPKGVPYGFRDFGQFREFATRFRDRMREIYPDLDMGFQGSSVTGRSADTGAPFDEGRVSDYDIANSGDSVNQAAHENGVQFRGDGVSTGPLNERDLDRLGLDGILDDVSAEVKHESDYRGIYFAARPRTGGKLRLQSNDLRDGDDEYYQEADLPEYRYLLFVDKFDRPDEVRTKLAPLPQWRFLYRSVVE